MKLWLKSKSGTLLGVIWQGNPGPVLATVVCHDDDRIRDRNVFFHNTGMFRGYPVYEEKS